MLLLSVIVQLLLCMKKMAKIVRDGLDARLPLLRGAQSAAMRPTRGWLRAVREAIGAKQEDIARKMGVKRQSYARLEATETRGGVSLTSLQNAADALDCEVVYYFMPRPSVASTYAELAGRHDPKLRHLRASEHSMALEDQAVGDLPTRQ